MVADGDAKAADDIEQRKHGPVEPGVVIEIPIKRDSDHSAYGKGAKEDDGPEPSATADLDRYTFGGNGERW